MVKSARRYGVGARQVSSQALRACQLSAVWGGAPRKRGSVERVRPWLAGKSYITVIVLSSRLSCLCQPAPNRIAPARSLAQAGGHARRLLNTTGLYAKFARHG